MLPYIKFLSQYWRRDRLKIGLIFLLVIFSQSLSLLEPFFFAKIIDNFLRDSRNLARFPTQTEFYQQLAFIIILWVIVAFGARLFKNLQLYFVGTVSDRIGIRIFEHAYSHLLRLPMSFHAARKSGEVFRKLSRARDDTTALFVVFFDKVFQNSFSIVAVTVIVFYKSWQMGAALVGFVPLFFLVTQIFTRRIKRTQTEINKANEHLFGSAFEALNHVELVKAFAAEPVEQSHLEADNLLSHVNLRKKTFAFQALGFAQGTVVNLARVILLWYGTVLAFRSQISFGNVILFNFYSFAVYQPLYDLGEIYTKYHEGIAAMDRLMEILRQPVSIKSKADAFVAKKLLGRVEFKNVSFSYESGREILQNISFLVEPGRRLGLVGPSGGGKSTIVKLLLRFYEPASGQILIDGRLIADYELSSLYKRVGLVLQDTVLFNATLAENIRYGTFEASHEAVAKVARRASLQSLINLLPQGLATVVGERGLKVSGGEKQRVAIARSILKQPDILIFDEATSALDSRTEGEIIENLREVSQGVTTITVAHRLATVVNSDEILFLSGGRITERGTHAELLAKAGEYARLYQLQTQNQREGV